MDRHEALLGRPHELRSDSLNEPLDLAPEQLEAVRAGVPVSLRLDLYSARLPVRPSLSEFDYDHRKRNGVFDSPFL